MDIENIEEWRGQEVIDRDGEKVGKLVEVFNDIATGEPVFASVKSGLLGRKVHLVALEGASLSRGHVRVPFSGDQVGSAPVVGEDGRITGEHEAALLTHYGVPAREGTSASDEVRYESGTVTEERRAAARAASERADRLEAEAAERAEAARVAGGHAAHAQRTEHDAAAESRRLAAEAAEARRAADES